MNSQYDISIKYIIKTSHSYTKFKFSSVSYLYSLSILAEHCGTQIVNYDVIMSCFKIIVYPNPTIHIVIGENNLNFHDEGLCTVAGVLKPPGSLLATGHSKAMILV